jgi:hypothetical protein
MIAPTTRAPLRNKSTARYLTPANGAAPSSSEPPTPATLHDPKVLGKLGLQPPPTDPRLLAAYLAKDDLADGTADADNFARGIRRAVRLDFAFAAKLHHQANQSWVEWVEAHFKAGYECYRRYHRAAELQLGLATRNLPLLTNENQARTLGSFRKHEQFWTAIGKSFPTEFPAGPEVKQKMQAALGLNAPSESMTPRVKLHRHLHQLVKSTPADDETVASALELLRRAIAVLEGGAA